MSLMIGKLEQSRTEEANSVDNIMEGVEDTVMEGVDSMIVKAEVGEESATGVVAKAMVAVGILVSEKMMMD